MADVELLPLRSDDMAVLPWQEDGLRSLLERWNRHEFPHALMLSGPAGVGKQRFATALAALLLCDTAIGQGVGINACGQCKQCRLLMGEGHPDARLVEPVERSRVIRVDQVRQVTSFAMASPQIAERKVVLLNRADLLNVSSANALLKTLEEPPADTFLLLLHAAGQPVLPTIRSRCQVLRMEPPAATEANEWLGSARPDVPPGDREQVLTWAAGAPLEAARLLDEGRPQQRRACLSALQSYLKGDLESAEAVKPFLGMPMEEALDLLLVWSRDLARCAVSPVRITDPEAAPMLEFLAGRNHPTALHELYQQTLKARQGLEHNVNAEMEFMVLLDQWRALMPVRSGARRMG